MPLPAKDSFTTDFRSGLADGHLPEGITAVTADGLAPSPAALAARFAVYRNNIMHSLSRALARRFPVIERLVGPEFFAAMAVEFIQAHPPRSPVLIHWGDDFAGFLQGFPPVSGLPYLPDVARLEYARGQAYHAADSSALNGNALAQLGDPGPFCLTLAPSVRVLRFDHPAVAIWQANQPGGDAAIRANGAQRALIFRQPDFQVPVHCLSVGSADFLTALLAGEPLAKAARHSKDPTPILTLLISQGLIIAAKPEDMP